MEPSNLPVAEEGDFISLVFPVAGLTFSTVYKELKETLEAGDKTLFLQPDPNNEYDKNAIAVVNGTGRIGFVPKTDNQAVGKFLSECARYEVVVLEHDRKKDYKTRLRLEVKFYDDDEGELSDDEGDLSGTED